MNVIDLPTVAITAPTWNPNSMDEAMLARLRRSIERHGLVSPLVVREVSAGRYETVGGAQRLNVLMELGHETVPCIVVEADGADARLLGQALNRISGQDDPVLKAQALKDILARFPAGEVLALLPESSEGLSGLESMGESSLAEQLQSWQRAQSHRLNHLGFHFTAGQLATVHRALATGGAEAPHEPSNPNRRSTVLAHICRTYLELRGGKR